jgi:four helix bundle protein
VISGEIAMTFDEWQQTVPDTLKADPLWRMEAYRLALFIFEIGWIDVTRLMKDERTLGLSNQLYRATGSIGANIAEGYSRSTGKDRARLYEYALGSAREIRVWYYGARHILGEEVVQHRLSIVTQIIRLLIVAIPHQREAGTIREDNPTYDVSPTQILGEIPFAPDSH